MNLAPSTWLLIIVLLFPMKLVHAEGNCPTGYYPIGAPSGQGGPQGCAPVPAYTNNQQQAQPESQPRWSNRWGAIAVDVKMGILGAAVGMAGQETAKQFAISECQAKGGTQCKLENSYGNACAAMIVGDTSLRINSATTMDEAVALGIKPCAAESKNCHVYYSACSMPVRTQ